ncbi:MAG: cobalt ECF transporter T component CbiQ [Symploca sp. SIO2G7]|nr:cobalt ECF transporter T component CbiQ [Symploca sp. SIO2G7]
MRSRIDSYSHLNSLIHKWEPRCKLVALLALIFAFSVVRQLALLPAMVLVTLVLSSLSRLPVAFFLSRLRYPGWFLAAIAILLPFTVGSTVIFQFGWLAVRQEGLLLLVLVATRFLCILTVSLIWFGTTPLLTNIKAMSALGLPAILAEMMLLSYRYIEQFAEDLTKMKRAMQLRGFRATKLSRRNLAVLASLAGTLLVRSYEQSEQVYRAMLLRGYGHLPQGRQYGRNRINRISPGDAIALGITLLIAIGFVVGELVI